MNRLDLCLNEAMANVTSHGEPQVHLRPIELALVLRQTEDVAAVELTMVDAGLPFDPTVATSRPRVHSLTEAEPGGLGIVMLRSNADALHYVHAAGLNTLTISVFWKAAGR